MQKTTTPETGYERLGALLDGSRQARSDAIGSAAAGRRPLALRPERASGWPRASPAGGQPGPT